MHHCLDESSIRTPGYLDRFNLQTVDQGSEMLVMCARSHEGEGDNLILRSSGLGCLLVPPPSTEVWEPLAPGFPPSVLILWIWMSLYCEQSSLASLRV